jgi:hypothetical protein
LVSKHYRIQLVDFGADEAFDGGDDTEHELTFTSPAEEEWIDYNIPLADFTDLAAKKQYCSDHFIGGARRWSFTLSRQYVLQ